MKITGLSQKIIIEVEAEGYAPEQINDTMTVGDLLEYLEDCNPGQKIYFSFNNHYSFGGLREEKIIECWGDDDE